LKFEFSLKPNEK
jgi:hypothetical protein